MSSPDVSQAPTVPHWRRILRNIFGLDVRSLALLRIGLGLLVLSDVVVRYSDLQAHYTDEGVMPRVFLPQGNSPFSVHLLDGSATYQAILFYVEGLAGLGLVLGWQTRFMTALAWLLVISLHARNPMVCHGGDKVLRLLLFWSLFLPLGAVFSVDSLSRPNPPWRVLSMGTVALIVQIGCIYWFAALMKYDPVWRTEGYAVYMSLSVGHFTTSLGRYLLNFPWLLSMMTFSTLWIEGVVPFLLFIPWRTWAFRLIAIVVFVGFHIGLGSCMELGNFPWVCSLAWLALLPTEAWDWVAARLRRPAREGLKLLYDPDSGPACEGLRFWTTALMLRDVETAPAPSALSLPPDLSWKGAWLAVDGEGRAHAGADGLRLLFRASPVFWPLAGLLSWPSLRGLGDWLAGVRREREADAKDPPPALDRPSQVQPLSAMTNVVIACLLVYIVAWNFGSWDEPHSQDHNPVYTAMLYVRDFVQVHFPPQNMTPGFSFALDQNWALFGPKPSVVHGWFVIIGTQKDGQKFDLLEYALHRNEVASTWERPDHIGATYPNSNWRKFLVNLISLNPPQYYQKHLFAHYLTNLWNDNHPAPEQQLQTIDMYLMEETTQMNYQPFTRAKVLLCHTDCVKMESKLEPVREPHD